MVTLQEAHEIAKSHYKGFLIASYEEHNDFWLFGIVDEDTGETPDGIWSPIVYKSDGHLDGYSPWQCPSLPKPISEGIFPECEQYREKFNRLCMERTGFPYAFPGEPDPKEWNEVQEDDVDIQQPEEPSKKSRLEKLSDSLLSLFGI